jgi:dynein heavy chain
MFSSVMKLVKPLFTLILALQITLHITVFFHQAVEHVCRLSRVLRQPRGNAMLVGVGGSGKQSLTRFAAFISGFKTFQIELSKSYGANEFREDLKRLYR